VLLGDSRFAVEILAAGAVVGFAVAATVAGVFCAVAGVPFRRSAAPRDAPATPQGVV
jgi:hypothetical protein